MPLRSAFPLILAAGLLAACANTSKPPQLEFGTLHLHESLQIEPNAATARLQYGRIVARNAVQEQDPFCVFEIDTVSARPQTVSPGYFSIVAVSQSIETIAGLPLGVSVRKVLFGDDDGPTHIYYKTTFRLQDKARTETQAVRALTCMSNQNAAGIAIMRHLTMAEIRGALGSWFTLKLEPSGNRT